MSPTRTRFMGTETEYGISSPDTPELSSIITSTHAVVAYAAFHTDARSRWDYNAEHPLRDSRGFDLRRFDTVPVVEPNAVGVANVITGNGGRFYVDHAHPEYSSPECANAWEAMVYDAAGDDIARQAIAAVGELSEQNESVLANHEPCPNLRFYKHNVDGKGASYGSHENYLYSRETDFDVLAKALIPFFVTRQVVVGAGRVGIGAEGEQPGFQISQRADYIEQEISLETTLNRGIINTRDEPHAEGDQARLHVIIGDANLSQTANFLKLGMTSLILDAIEAGVDFSDLGLVDAVGEVRLVSRDLSLKHRLKLEDGRRLTALELLAEFRARVSAQTEIECRVLECWDEAVSLLADDPASAAHLLDWPAKYRLIQGYLSRGIDIADPKLKLIDLQYCDLDPEKSLYQALVRRGQMRTLVAAEEISNAAQQPPGQSRAYFRGQVMTKWGTNVVAASWQSVSLRLPDDSIAVIPMDRVDSFTQGDLEEMICEVTTPSELIARLKQLGYCISIV